MLKPGKQWVLISPNLGIETLRSFGLSLNTWKTPMKGKVLAIGPLDKDEISICNVGDTVFYYPSAAESFGDDLLVKTYNILAVE